MTANEIQLTPLIPSIIPFGKNFRSWSKGGQPLVSQLTVNRRSTEDPQFFFMKSTVSIGNDYLCPEARLGHIMYDIHDIVHVVMLCLSYIQYVHYIFDL